MSSDTRRASRGSSRSKRRMTDAVNDGRQVPAADDAASNPKRQRVSRACDSCRSKKDKCDGAQPVCSTCASLSRPCTYKANPKKRGLPTGYIRTLELLWALVFTKIQGSEEVVRTMLRTAIPSHLATMGKEAESSDTLLSSWKNSIVLKEIERLLTALEQPEDEQQERGARIPGELDSPADAEGSSELSSEMLEWHLPDPITDGRESSLTGAPSPAKTPTAARTIRQTSMHITRDSATQTVSEGHPPLQRQPNYLSNSAAQDRYTQLPSNPWPLLDIYFSYTQCWFPILEKHDILRTAFRRSDNDERICPSSAGSGDHAALWAVLALSSIQEASIPATRQLPDMLDDRPDPNQFYANAKSLIPEESGVYEIGHVQALLIMSLIKLGQQDWAAAWILVGQAVRIAQSLGLNSFPNAQASATEEGKAGGRSKHVFLGCFILETLVAVRTGQVPSLRKGDLTKAGPINEDGLEEWHPWEDQTGLRPTESSRSSFHRGPLHALSTFNRLLSLMCILNDLCCWGQAPTSSLSHLEALERQLQLWVSALPMSYRIDLQTVSTKPAAPHIFSLEVMYEGIATAINLQLAAQRNDRNGLRRASDSSNRLISLLQAYKEMYSLSATSPTFGLVLTLGLPQPGMRRTAPWVLETDPSVRSKLQSFSAHLATVWSIHQSAVKEIASDSHKATYDETCDVSDWDGSSDLMDSGNPQTRAERVTPTASATLRQGNCYSRSPLTQIAPGSNPRVTNLISESRTAALSGPDSFLPPTWMRTSTNPEDNTASLPTPTPSLSIASGMEASNVSSQLKYQTPRHHRRSVSGRPPNGTAMVSDLMNPFPGPGSQYQQTYDDPSLHFNPLVDIEGQGSLRRQIIAPELDALFDELASLDGTDRIDNQPQFMQNLGFVPEAGIPELYPYTSQTGPYHLAAPQQTLTSSETGSMRHESRVATEPALNPNR